MSSDRAQTTTQKPAEETRIHTRIACFQLGVEESRAYWTFVDGSGGEHSALEAYSQQWFGSVSENRAKVIMRDMRARYDAFPAALDVLAKWREMTPATRTIICHWHLQLADPLYREFSGVYLVEHRHSYEPELHREKVVRWVGDQQPDRWSRSTRVAFASKLLTAAHCAGLVETNRDPRPLVYPRVTDEALSYFLHLLREIRFEGTLLDNPYLRSVGMSGKFLEDRLRTLRGAELRRMGDLVEFDTDAPDLKSWSHHNLTTSEAV